MGEIKITIKRARKNKQTAIIETDIVVMHDLLEAALRGLRVSGNINLSIEKLKVLFDDVEQYAYPIHKPPKSGLKNNIDISNSTEN